MELEWCAWWSCIHIVLFDHVLVFKPIWQNLGLPPKPYWTWTKHDTYGPWMMLEPCLSQKYGMSSRYTSQSSQNHVMILHKSKLSSVTKTAQSHDQHVSFLMFDVFQKPYAFKILQNIKTPCNHSLKFHP